MRKAEEAELRMLLEGALRSQRESVSALAGASNPQEVAVRDQCVGRCEILGGVIDFLGGNKVTLRIWAH